MRKPLFHFFISQTFFRSRATILVEDGGGFIHFFFRISFFLPFFVRVARSPTQSWKKSSPTVKIFFAPNPCNSFSGQSSQKYSQKGTPGNTESPSPPPPPSCFVNFLSRGGEKVGRIFFCRGGGGEEKGKIESREEEKERPGLLSRKKM